MAAPASVGLGYKWPVPSERAWVWVAGTRWTLPSATLQRAGVFGSSVSCSVCSECVESLIIGRLQPLTGFGRCSTVTLPLSQLIGVSITTRGEDLEPMDSFLGLRNRAGVLTT